jgi:hypothetical protein
MAGALDSAVTIVASKFKFRGRCQLLSWVGTAMVPITVPGSAVCR